jgi:hypothetical protein
MDGGRMPRRILEWKPMGRRIRGRPRKRWIEDVEEDGNKRMEKTEQGKDGMEENDREG